MLRIEKKNAVIRGSLKGLLCACLLGFVLAGCAPQDDVSFARSFMDQLVQGRYTVCPLIDWPQLKFFGYDVGKQDSAVIKSEATKIDYQRFFVRMFSTAFGSTRAGSAAFSDWRLYKEDADVKVVAANYLNPNTVFLLYISHQGGERKVIEMELLRNGEMMDANSLVNNKGGKGNVPVFSQTP